jgi:hypothetical protein
LAISRVVKEVVAVGTKPGDASKLFEPPMGAATG